MKIIITLLTSMLLVGAVQAGPQKGGNKKPEGAAKAKHGEHGKFKKLDTDGDKKISLAEFTANAKDAEKAKAHFAKLDKDSDGFLVPGELKKPKKK